MLVITEFQRFPGISKRLKNSRMIKETIFKYLRNNVLDLPGKTRTLSTKLYVILFHTLTSLLYKHIFSTPPDEWKFFGRHFKCRGYFVDNILKVVTKWQFKHDPKIAKNGIAMALITVFKKYKL